MVLTFLFERYETENGILAEESGIVEILESGDDALKTTGFYQYTGDDGKLYRVDYVADVNGFVAKVYYIIVFTRQMIWFQNEKPFFFIYPKGDHLPI